LEPPAKALMQFPRAKSKPIIINKGRVLWQLIDLRLAFVEGKPEHGYSKKFNQEDPKNFHIET
jgi:hypothetical protein